VHRDYGLLPNMSWVLDRGGSILYKAMWTSAAHIGDFLEARAASPAGGTLSESARIGFENLHNYEVRPMI